MNIAIIKLENGETTIILNLKDFKTGSNGFFGQGKLVCTDGKRYQCNIICVEIGTKPKDEKKTK